MLIKNISDSTILKNKVYMFVDQEQFRLLKKNTLLRGIQEEYLN
jgi:hypothetical protein